MNEQAIENADVLEAAGTVCEAGDLARADTDNQVVAVEQAPEVAGEETEENVAYPFQP